MSGREKRSVSQPESYREFDKTGRSLETGGGNTGENDDSVEVFAPTNDPDLGLENRIKKRVRSRKDKTQEEESSGHGPNIIEKELLVSQEVISRQKDDIQAEMTKNSGKNLESHVAEDGQLRAELPMHDAHKAVDPNSFLGASAHVPGAEMVLPETEKKKSSKTPRKKGKKVIHMAGVTATEFGKILGSGTTLDMMTDEQVARLSEEQFNQLLDHEQDREEQLAREKIVRVRRHQQQIMKEKRLRQQAEIELQEQQFQQELYEAQQVRQKLELEARRPARLVDNPVSYNFEDEVETLEPPQANKVREVSPPRFIFQSKVNETQSRGDRARVGRTPAAAAGGRYLGFKFIQEPLGFNQLTFEHLIVGEITTICNCQNMVEAKHRMRLLERIGYWRLRGADWSQTRAFYAAIIAGIEAEEFNWDVSFADIESMIIDKPLVAAAVKPDKKNTQRGPKKAEGLWFCKEFNSEGGYEQEAGHNITTPRGDIKPAQHVCAKCWRLKKQRKEHSESSGECPFKAQIP